MPRMLVKRVLAERSQHRLHIGECAAILENPLRMPMLTFRMYMGRAHSRLLASLTPHLAVQLGLLRQKGRVYGSKANKTARSDCCTSASSRTPLRWGRCRQVPACGRLSLTHVTPAT